VILKRADAVLDVQERKDLLYQAAQIQEELLEDPDAAARIYAQVLEIDDSDRRAMEALERLYLQLESWEHLRDLYVRQVELFEDVETKKQILHRLGTIYTDKLNDLERAIESYTQALDLDASDDEALQSLDLLYQAEQRWYDLLQVLERRVELAGDTSPEAVDIKHRTGKLWQNDLGDLTHAVETYREVLELNPAHEDTLAALSELAHGEEEAVLAAQVLEPIYTLALEWERLIDMLEVMVQHADDPYQKVELLGRIARLQEEELGTPEEAFKAQARALREEPGNAQVLSALERLAGVTGQWGALAALYEDLLDKLFDDRHGPAGGAGLRGGAGRLRPGGGQVQAGHRGGPGQPGGGAGARPALPAGGAVASPVRDPAP